MFWRKKLNISEEENIPLTPKGWLKKVDTIVTWILLGGVLASIYGIKRKKDKKNQSLQNENQDQLSLFEEEKPSFWKRIFRRK